MYIWSLAMAVPPKLAPAIAMHLLQPFLIGGFVDKSLELYTFNNRVKHSCCKCGCYLENPLQKQLQYLHLHTYTSMQQLMQNADYSQLQHATSKMSNERHAFCLASCLACKATQDRLHYVARLHCLYLLMT